MAIRIDPHQLTELTHNRQPEHLALDTETSGLYTDAGARPSTISIAWTDPHGAYAQDIPPGQHTTETGIVTYLPEKTLTGEPLWVLSLAWPFDQGTDNTNKPEDTGATPLWGQNQNHDATSWRHLIRWIEQNHLPLVMHHAKFDCHMLAAGLRDQPETGWPAAIDHVTWDTQNVTSLIWGMHGTTALKPTFQRVFDEHVTDEQQTVKNYLATNKLPTGRWDLIPWDVIAKYADLDARLTIRLHHAQQAQIASDPKLTRLVQRRLDTTKMLYRMERRGLPFDRELALQESERLTQREEQLRQQLPFTPATLPTAKHYWFGRGTKKGVTGLELDPIDTTETGQPKLDASTVRELISRQTPGAQEWAELNKALNANSRWYHGWAQLAGPDGKLRGTVRQNGTRSGRFSIERVQLQAVPHDYRLEGYQVLEGITTPRGLIGAGVKPGQTLWELDLANAELRVAAKYAGCVKMLELIHQGADLHGETAQELFKVKPDSPDWYQYRTIAKRANFSLIFGVGWAKLQDDIYTQTGVAMSDYDARELVEGWNALYPEYRRAINKAMWRVEDRQKQHRYGWVKMSNGEHRWFTETEEAHKAFNQRVQGNLAQFGIDWWLQADQLIDQQLQGHDPGFGLVMLIHDSMVLLLPSEHQLDEQIVQGVVEIGERLWGDWFKGVPGGVDPEVWATGDQVLDE